MPNDSPSYVVFSVQAHRFALPLGNVRQITRAVPVRRVPGAPAPILGVANIRGRLLPVVSLPQWLGLPTRPTAPSDQFIIAQARGQTAVLVVGAITGRLDDGDDALTRGAQIVVNRGRLRGAVRRADDLILLTDLVPLMSLVADFQDGAFPAADVA